jgi:hypothetical protein
MELDPCCAAISRYHHKRLALVNCTPSAVDPYVSLVFRRLIDERAVCNTLELVVYSWKCKGRSNNHSGRWGEARADGHCAGDMPLPGD